MNYQVTKELVEESIKAKINKVDGECALIVPEDATQEQFDLAVKNLIARGKRNFSQALDNHSEFNFANLISTKTRAGGEPKVKLPVKVNDAIGEAVMRLNMDRASGAFDKRFKAKGKGRTETEFAVAMLIHLVNTKLGDTKGKKGILKDTYAAEILSTCENMAMVTPKDDILEADF